MSPQQQSKEKRKQEKQRAAEKKRNQAEQDNAYLDHQINQLIDRIIVVLGGGTPPQ